MTRELPKAPLRVAVVGAGLMGRWHAYYAHRQGAQVVAIVDRARAAAESLSRRVKSANVFTDMASMLDEKRPQVVHICTPLDSHGPLAQQAIAAGVHALVEKPLTNLASETQALLETARMNGIRVCPVHQFGFQAGVARAATALAGLGEALHASFTICSAGGGTATGAELDDIVADILPHPFSVLQRLWPGNLLQARDWTANSARHGELRIQGSSGGTAVQAYVSMNARPTRCDLDILCTEGSIHLNFFHGYAVVRRGRPSRLDKVMQPFWFAGKTFAAAGLNLAGRALRGDNAYPGLGSLIGRFHAAARAESGNPIPERDTLAAATVREHVIQQAIPGVLAVPGTDRRQRQAGGREPQRAAL